MARSHRTSLRLPGSKPGSEITCCPNNRGNDMFCIKSLHFFDPPSIVVFTAQHIKLASSRNIRVEMHDSISFGQPLIQLFEVSPNDFGLLHPAYDTRANIT